MRTIYDVCDQFKNLTRLQKGNIKYSEEIIVLGTIREIEKDYADENKYIVTLTVAGLGTVFAYFDKSYKESLLKYGKGDRVFVIGTFVLSELWRVYDCIDIRPYSPKVNKE